MARIESDKEDLIRDATALVERAEFGRVPESAANQGWQLATVGFRADQSLSIYLDQDPFYQFDSSGRLRRALEHEFLYRSQATTLARLHRKRSDDRTTLVRYDLTESELYGFQQRMRHCLAELSAGIRSQSCTVLRIVSDCESSFSDRVSAALQRILSHDSDFLSRSVRRRR